VAQWNLTAEEAALAGSQDPQEQERWEALLEEARLRSARGGQWGPFLEYEAIELCNPEGETLATVEADAWAPAQRALAARLLELSDAEDHVPADAARALLQECCGSHALSWAGKPGLDLAERLGCWQAYASIRAQRWKLRDE
jgi:hypothetical protein